jgi:peptide/nickel transport system permease protein
LRLAPGDAAYIRLQERNIDLTPQALAAARAELGLDRPLIEQYGRWLNDIAHLKLGASIISGEPVAEGLARHFRITLLLAVPSIIFTMMIAFPLGIFSALRQGKLTDGITRAAAIVFMSVPGFCLAFIFILIFAVRLKWLPSFGVGRGGVNTFVHLVMPCLTLGILGAAYYMRFIRSALLEELSGEYVRAAKARGINTMRILVFDALKNAAIPITSSLGISLALMLGGQAVIEKVFSIPGIGAYLIDGVMRRDYPVVQGCVLLYAFLFVTINLAVDMLCIALDPKTQARSAAIIR